MVRALRIRKAVQEDNMHAFFILYKDVSSFGKHLLNLNLDPWRVQYLQRIVKAYKPQVEVAFVLKELSLPLSAEGLEFLIKCGVKLVESSDSTLEAAEINTKDSIIDPSALQTQETTF